MSIKTVCFSILLILITMLKYYFIFTSTSVFYKLTKELVEFVSQVWRFKRITHHYIFDKTFPETITLLRHAKDSALPSGITSNHRNHG